jgi:hypothetical protein
MEFMPTMLVKLEHTERQKAPFLMCQMSKWFYDTSTGTATRAAPLLFFVGVGLSL